jgi:hypothetical protein
MSKNLSIVDDDGNIISYDSGRHKSEVPLSVRIVIITGIFPVTAIKPARLSFLYFDTDYIKDIISKFPYCFYGDDEAKNQEICDLLNIKKNALNTIKGNYIKKAWTDWIITPIYNKDKINKFLKII